MASPRFSYAKVAMPRPMGDGAGPTRGAALDCVSADRHADISKFPRLRQPPCGYIRFTGLPQTAPRGRAAFRAAPHEALTMEAQVRGRGDAFRRFPPVWAGQRLAERLHC